MELKISRVSRFVSFSFQEGGNTTQFLLKDTRRESSRFSESNRRKLGKHRLLNRSWSMKFLSDGNSGRRKLKEPSGSWSPVY